VIDPLAILQQENRASPLALTGIDQEEEAPIGFRKPILRPSELIAEDLLLFDIPQPAERADVDVWTVFALDRFRHGGGRKGARPERLRGPLQLVHQGCKPLHHLCRRHVLLVTHGSCCGFKPLL
jgi:hypothetical protein